MLCKHGSSVAITLVYYQHSLGNKFNAQHHASHYEENQLQPARSSTQAEIKDLEDNAHKGEHLTDNSLKKPWVNMEKLIVKHLGHEVGFNRLVQPV